MKVKEIYDEVNIRLLAKLLVARWGDEALERAKYVAGNNNAGMRLMLQVQELHAQAA